MSHGQVICTECQKVIMSCRCMDCVKHTTYAICEDCKTKVKPVKIYVKDGEGYKPFDITTCDIKFDFRNNSCELLEISFISLSDIPDELKPEYLQDIKDADKLGGVQRLHAYCDIQLKWQEKLGL